MKWNQIGKKTLALSMTLSLGILLNSCGKNEPAETPPTPVAVPQPAPVPTNNVIPSIDFINSCNYQGGQVVVSGSTALCQRVIYPPNLYFDSGRRETRTIGFGNLPSGVPVLKSGSPQGDFLPTNIPYSPGVLIESEDKLTYSCGESFWRVYPDGSGNDMQGNASTLMATTGTEVLQMGVSGSLYFRQGGYLRLGFSDAPSYVNTSFDSAWRIRCTNIMVVRCEDVQGTNYPCP